MSKWLKALAVIALPVAMAGLAAPAAHAGKCMKITGHGTGVTQGIAKFMAEAAVKNGISGRNLKPSGHVSTSCKSGSVVMANCTAVQTACP